MDEDYNFQNDERGSISFEFHKNDIDVSKTSHEIVLLTRRIHFLEKIPLMKNQSMLNQERQNFKKMAGNIIPNNWLTSTMKLPSPRFDN